MDNLISICKYTHIYRSLDIIYYNDHWKILLISHFSVPSFLKFLCHLLTSLTHSQVRTGSGKAIRSLKRLCVCQTLNVVESAD